VEKNKKKGGKSFLENNKQVSQSLDNIVLRHILINWVKAMRVRGSFQKCEEKAATMTTKIS